VNELLVYVTKTGKKWINNNLFIFFILLFLLIKICFIINNIYLNKLFNCIKKLLNYLYKY
jgi:hypothetical protein